MSIRTEWDGRPCLALRGTAIVTDDWRFSEYWARELVGTRRKIVIVYAEAGAKFVLDDEDGAGWRKVTNGGGWRLPHRNLSIDWASVEIGS